MLRVCVAGCFGRMGTSIVNAVDVTDDIIVSIGTVSSASINKASREGVACKVSDIVDLTSDFDVCIDFTSPASTLAHLEKLVELNKPVVIGTTGLNKDELSIIKDAGENIPIVLAPNTSLGVNMLYAALDFLTKKLPDTWQVKIEETHHIHKKDNPSGTAVKLAKAVEDNLNIKPDCTGYREGEVIGNHKVIISGKNEELVLEHDAKDRALFAEGAILAARWIKNKKPGIYEMKDVLGLN